MPELETLNLPFQEAIDFYRDKIRLPTRSWTDITEGMHSRAFVVAGAVKDDLLVDFQTSIDQAISQGTGYAAFREQFDDIVKRHGWSYNGGAGWRSRVIYKTNMQTAYMAGRYNQLQALKRSRPFWRYKHSDLVENPRAEHVAWDGLVLDADDPWWSTHYPPNGWGCRCKVYAMNARDLQRRGKDGPDQAPPLNAEDKVIGVRGPSPKTVSVPEGIDPGWGYSVGESAWGQTLADDVMAGFRAQGPKSWQRLNTENWAALGRPERVPLDSTKTKLARPVTTVAGAEGRLKKLFKGDRVTVQTPAMPLSLNAQAMAANLDLNRSAYFPFIIETLENPFEVWLSFEKHLGSGKIELRSRFVKALDIGKGKSVMVVANAQGGHFQGWTFYPRRNLSEINKDRQGSLAWSR